ncbi:MAG: nitroreductase family protein [Putridiphycobacter sp.]
MNSNHKQIPYQGLNFTEEESLAKSQDFFALMNQRRSVRFFSTEPVQEAIINNIIKTAGTAPSGAHKQPWSFCVITNPDLKKQIRIAAEKEEQLNYSKRMSETWLNDLEPIGTNENKPFLEHAPILIALFRKPFDYDEEGSKTKNYYVNESVGIAAGFLITAIHNAGLSTLTHTPSPMNFLEKILARPDNEKAYLLLPVGYPSNDCTVPDFTRKNLNEIAFYYK